MFSNFFIESGSIIMDNLVYVNINKISYILTGEFEWYSYNLLTYKFKLHQTKTGVIKEKGVDAHM